MSGEKRIDGKLNKIKIRHYKILYFYLIDRLRLSVADPDPGSGAYWTPGSKWDPGWVKNQDPDLG